MHVQREIQIHNQFPHFAMQHLTNMLQTIQNNNRNKHLRIDKFTQLQFNDYKDNPNTPPQVTILQPKIQISTSQRTRSHAPPITTCNTHYSMCEQYQG